MITYSTEYPLAAFRLFTMASWNFKTFFFPDVMPMVNSLGPARFASVKVTPHNIQEGNLGACFVLSSLFTPLHWGRVEDIHEVACLMFAKQHMGSAVLCAFCHLEKYVWAFCFQVFSLHPEQFCRSRTRRSATKPETCEENRSATAVQNLGEVGPLRHKRTFLPMTL